MRDTAGHAIDISGNASVLATGIAISAIQSGKSADGVAVSGSGNVTLAGLSITDIKHTAIRVQPEFTGILTFSGISQHNANRGLFDDGSTGTIVGSGSFRTNSAMTSMFQRIEVRRRASKLTGQFRPHFIQRPRCQNRGVLFKMRPERIA